MRVLLLLFCLFYFQIVNGQVSSFQSFTFDEGIVKSSQIQTEDGGTLLGLNEIFNTGQTQKSGFRLIKFNTCDEVVWKKEFSNPSINMDLLHIKQIPNSEDFILIGSSFKLFQSDKYTMIIRIDGNGNILHFKQYDHLAYKLSYCYDFYIIGDELNLICKFSEEIVTGVLPPMVIIKADLEGNIISTKKYIGSWTGIESNQTSDGGLILRSANSVLKLDPLGNVLWAKEYPFLLGSTFYNILTVDDGYIIAVYSGSNLYLVKLSEQGDIVFITVKVNFNSYPRINLINNEIISITGQLDVQGVLFPYFIQYNLNGEITNQYLLSDVTNLYYLPQTVIMKNNSLDCIYQNTANLNEVLLVKNVYSSPCLDSVNYPTEGFDPGTNYTDLGAISYTEVPITEKISGNNINANSFEFTHDTRCEGIIETEDISEIGYIDCTIDYTFDEPFEDAAYFWLDNGSTSSTRTFEEEGSYDLIIETCNRIYNMHLDIVSICHCNLEIPNAFSPNNDGLNDYFEINNPCGELTSYELKIFDRWGKTLFATNEISDFWNGELNGELIQDNVLIYQIKYTPLSLHEYVDMKHLEGQLLLLR